MSSLAISPSIGSNHTGNHLLSLFELLKYEEVPPPFFFYVFLDLDVFQEASYFVECL